MARQNRELHYRLEDTEKLRLYAQSATSKHHALEESLDKANSQSKHWELKAKEGTERIRALIRRGTGLKRKLKLPSWLLSL